MPVGTAMHSCPMHRATQGVCVIHDTTQARMRQNSCTEHDCRLLAWLATNVGTWLGAGWVAAPLGGPSWLSRCDAPYPSSPPIAQPAVCSCSRCSAQDRAPHAPLPHMPPIIASCAPSMHHPRVPCAADMQSQYAALQLCAALRCSVCTIVRSTPAQGRCSIDWHHDLWQRAPLSADLHPTQGLECSDLTPHSIHNTSLPALPAP